MKNLKLLTFLTAFIIITMTFLPLISYTNAEDCNSRVDVTVEIIGIPGLQSKTKSLTMAQNSKIQSILNSISASINDDTSKHEAWSIIQPLITTLQKYGFLPKSMIFTILLKFLFENRMNERKDTPSMTGDNDYINNRCIVIGRGLSDGGLLWNTIWVGEQDYTSGTYHTYPVNGWVWSKGSEGVIYRNGTIWGQLGCDYFPVGGGSPDEEIILYRGAVYFWGFVINGFYFGIAKQVGIDNPFPG